jgi:hypothetical protein
VDRVVVDTMAAKKKVIGLDPVPHIRMAHFLAPRGIDLSHFNYIIMDGLYTRSLHQGSRLSQPRASRLDVLAHQRRRRRGYRRPPAQGESKPHHR